MGEIIHLLAGGVPRQLVPPPPIELGELTNDEREFLEKWRRLDPAAARRLWRLLMKVRNRRAPPPRL